VIDPKTGIDARTAELNSHIFILNTGDIEASSPTGEAKGISARSVFAKLDVTFGDDLEGIGGKAGMRVSW
jgi:hypothetical protein